MSDELEWTETRDSFYEAAGAEVKGRYVLYPYKHGTLQCWRCEYVPYPGAFNAVHEVSVTKDIDVCKAKAQAHYAARVRKLAWARYMEENDPPVDENGLPR